MNFSFTPRTAATTTNRAEAELPRSAADTAHAPQALTLEELAQVSGGTTEVLDLPVNGW